jgi:zinc/manganese transport system substrate-binding protein
MQSSSNRLLRCFRRALLLAVAATAPAQAAAALHVFACEPEWASLTRELGGDAVDVYQASTAQQDPHRIEAKPSLIARMRNADLVVCTGAELEIGWLPVLLQTAGNNRVQPGTPGYFEAAAFIQTRDVPTHFDRAAGDVHPRGNPHIHLDPHNVAVVAAALAERLQAIDPANAAGYRARGAAFLGRWNAAVARWERTAAGLRGMKIVTYHKDTTYLEHWLGLVEVMTVEPKPGLPPTTAHLAELVGQLGPDSAAAITRFGFQDPKPVEWLAARTGLPVVELPYTVGASEQVTDLFTLFDGILVALGTARR